MADVSVRPARVDDVAEIARIQVTTWQHAYAEILPAPVLDAVTVEAATAAWTDAISASPSPHHHVLVAQEQQWLVGFVVLAPADDLPPDDLAPESTAAVGPILVEPRWGRRGHGSRLMAAAVDTARTDGMARGISWIPEADTVTREFLIGAGWAPDGLVRALDTGAGELREIRLHTVL
ncbi:MAG TPA: GNAT family N-acetyltransferase [Jatrophihabitantaceae bacterium]